MYPTINLEATGANMRAIASTKGIKPQDIQEALGLEYSQTIYKWYKGQRLPTIDNLYALSKLLETPIEQILICNENN